MSNSSIDAINTSLLKQCKDGNHQAFDELVNNTKDDIYALAFRYTRDREFAFDICQEAYIKLYKFIPKWNYSCRVQTWLYRVVTNACIDHHRKHFQKFLSLDVEENIAQLEARCPQKESNPRKQLQIKERRQHLEHCIALLPKKMQATFRLRYIGGLSHKEISEVQGCSIGTVKASLHQAVKKLRSYLVKAEEKHREIQS